MDNSRKDERFLWLDDLFASIFKVAYIMNVSPLKVEYDDKQSMYYIKKSSTLRQVICLLPTLITVTVMLISINASFVRMSIQTPSMIFGVATELGDSFLCLMLLHVIWFRQEDITRYFSLLSLRRSEEWRKLHEQGQNDTATYLKFQRKGKTLAIIISISGVFIVGACNVLQTFLQLLGILNLHSLGIESIPGFVYVHLSNGLFIRGEQMLRIGEMNTFQLVASTTFIFNYSIYKALNAFSILLCLGGVVVVFHKMWEFTNFLQEETNELAFMRKLQAFKEDVESVNQVIGPIMFGIAIVAGPPFFVINFARMVTSWNVHTLFVGLTWALYAAILIGAAEVSYMTYEICEWILSNGEGEHEDELFGIFVEHRQSSIGLRGMECLTITYRYMAQMFSAVTTFVIILLQFTSAPGGEEWILDG